MEHVSLNGLWSFTPEYNGPGSVPPEKPGTDQILVPSGWNKSPAGVRLPGERYYHPCKPSRGAGFGAEVAALGAQTEFLFDTYDYPLAWTSTRNGWITRQFDWTDPRKDERVFLEFEGVSPRCVVFLDGTEIGSNDDPCLPFSFDIAPCLSRGSHRIDVHVIDHQYDAAGRTLSPSGNAFMTELTGIWQDVRLTRRGAVRCDEVWITTSTRRRLLELRLKLINGSKRSRTVTLKPELPIYGPDIPPRQLTLAPGEHATCRYAIRWDRPRLWSPDDPFLWMLRTQVWENGKPIDIRHDRFGFREVWIEGRDIMLNGAPVRLFSDWGHKASDCHLTEGWIRAWYRMIKDGSMNHSRLHSHPHPSIFLDLADELGILITDETALFGAGGGQAADSALYWSRAQDHVRRLVLRDHNHPSVILYSVENEMRWNGDTSRRTIKELPALRRLFEDLDPTRPAYHDGDSSLWNEQRQPMISRHYGKECTGLGWWDRTKPLHAGELSLYHYAGPNNTVHQGGDQVWADYHVIDRAAAHDTASIVEDGRSNGVSCFGPWNISCHQNLRLHERISPEYQDLSAPGAKPQVIRARTSEFEFWHDPERAPQYHPLESFAIQKSAFRRFACIDRTRRTGYYATDRFARTIHLANDTGGPQAGDLVIHLEISDQFVYDRRFSYALGPGEIRSESIEVVLPSLKTAAEMEYRVRFVAGVASVEAIDDWRRTIRIEPKSRTHNHRCSLFAIGEDSATGWAIDRGAVRLGSVHELDSVERPDPVVALIGARVLRGTVAEKQTLSRFCRRGGRLIMLEQETSLFDGLPSEHKVVQSVFPRAPHHPVLEGLDAIDLAYWGDGAYGDPSGDSHVARILYRKNDLAAARSIVDTGEGNFGDGDLEYLAILEAPVEVGVVIACQLKIAEAIDTIPAASRLLANMIDRATTYTFDPEPRFRHISREAGSEELRDAIDEASAGGVLFLDNPTPEQCRLAGVKTGMEIKLDDVTDCYQAVRRISDPLIDGVSNWDTNGIETYCYSQEERTRNHLVASRSISIDDPGAVLLETPTVSCGAELFVHGGRTELLRSHCVSTSLNTPQEPQPVLIRFPHGTGTIVVSMFAPEDDSRARFARLANQIALNCGAMPSRTILDGETVPAPAHESNGYPTQVNCLAGPFDRATVEDMRQRTIQGYERMASTAMLEIPGWKTVACPHGEVPSIGGTEAIYFTIYSAVPRTHTETNLAIPNPEALTNLDLSGDGTVEVTVNGNTRQAVGDASAVATVADIAVERGYNYVLLIRHDARGPLSLRWRTTMRNPETTFRFG